MIDFRPPTPVDGTRVMAMGRTSIDATHDFLQPADRQATAASLAAFCRLLR